MPHGDAYIEMVKHYLEEQELAALKTLLLDSEEKEIHNAFHHLSLEDQVIVFRLLAKDRALEIFEELDTDQQQNLLSHLSNERLVEYLNEIPPDDKVRLLDELPAMVAKRLLAQLDPAERDATYLIMGYEADSAGRTMTTEYLALHPSMTVTQALAKIRERAPEVETIYTLYATDRRKLVGVLSLRELLLAKPDQLVEDLMHSNVVSVNTHTDQEEVARTLHNLDFLAIPVVDNEKRLVGIITVDDAMDILEDEATDDMLAGAGIANIHTKEASRSEVLLFGKLPQVWRLRLPFLVITTITGLVAGSVIDGFEQSIASVAALAVFIPVVMAMGGNVGTQSAISFTRGLLLGHIQMKDFFKRLVHEITVGASMGVIIGTIVGTVSYLWFGYWQLGLVIGLSLVSCMTIASILGFVVPYVLVRSNLDQATGTGPLITSISDVTGLLVYFTLASILMSHFLP
ncbi:MAG: magnesium transporter [Coriobacteriia bacterium]|nr:magnesium transporter [Coriobacteriia bacterium]